VRATENSEAYIKRGLRDCGFKAAAAEEYLQYAREQRQTEQLRLLNLHRRKLMGDLHTAQKQVDVMDFLIRSLEEENK